MAAVLHSASRLREVTKVEGDDSFDPALDGCRQAVMLENLIKRRIREDKILRVLVEGTVSETGTEFFRALARNLSEALQTCGAWVTEYLPESPTTSSLGLLDQRPLS